MTWYDLTVVTETNRVINVSVLLPTRGRQDSLRRSVRRLLELAADPRSVEVLIAVDRDDTGAVHEAAFEVGNHVAVYDQRCGYHRLHEYFNHLAEVSRGVWLLLWNDDAEMTTPGWDDVLRELAVTDPHAAVADLRTQLSPHLCTFPAVTRWAYEAVGTFSPTCHCDTWWQDVSRRSGTIRDVDVHVIHRRADLTGEHNDRTRAESLAGYRSVEFYGERIQGLIADAAERVRDRAALRAATVESAEVGA